MLDKNQPRNTDSKSVGRNPLILISEIGLLGLIIGFLIFGSRLGNTPTQLNTEQPLNIVGAVQVGQEAPDFTLVNVDGEQITLSELHGRPVIINFWATWCAPCRYEMPELQQVFEAYAEDNLELLAINREERTEEVNLYFDELAAEEGIDFTFPSLLDDKGEVTQSYGVFNMPTTFFIDAGGTVTAVHFGPLNRFQIEEYLKETLIPSTN